jgi:hypothetical protein
MKAIQIETFSNPAEAVNVPDVGPPAPGEVVIALDRLAPLIAAKRVIRLHVHLSRSHEGGIHGQA